MPLCGTDEGCIMKSLKAGKLSSLIRLITQELGCNVFFCQVVNSAYLDLKLQTHFKEERMKCPLNSTHNLMFFCKLRKYRGDFF